MTRLSAVRTVAATLLAVAVWIVMASGALAAAGPPKAVMQTGVGLGTVESVAWLPDGNHVMTLSDTGLIIFWEAATGRIVDRLGQENCMLRLDAGGAGVIAQPGRTNCIIPEIKPPPPWPHTFLQTKALDVSPDGRFAVLSGGLDDGEVTAQSDAFETQLYDIESRRVAGWFHRRARLWIGAARSRLVVEPVGGCGPGACALSLLDPETLGETPLGATPLAGRLSGGGLIAAAPRAERLAAVFDEADGAHSLRVFSSVDLSLVARFALDGGQVAEVGFDSAGARVYARTAGGMLRIFDLSGGAAPQVVSLAFIHGAAAVMTDIDAHAVLVRVDRPDSDADEVFDYVKQARLSAAAGQVMALFSRQGGVLIDQRGDARPLRQAGDDMASGGWGPALALSPDGGRLLSGRGIYALAALDSVDGVDSLDSGSASPGLTGFQVVDANPILPSPDGLKFAFQRDPAMGADGPQTWWVFDMESGRLVRLDPSRAAGERTLASWTLQGWESNDRLVFDDGGGRYLAVSVRGDPAQRLVRPPAMISPYDPPPGGGQPDCQPSRVRPEGQDGMVVLSACYKWQWFLDGQLKFVSARDWKMLFSLMIHPDGTWFVLGAGDRYDTNGRADTSDVRWLRPEQPWTSLPVQTFMRDFYQPGLMGRLLDCNRARTCDTALKPLPDLSTLSWVLPRVAIAAVEPGSSPDTVSVVVQAVEGEDPKAPPALRWSGVYDLRLFRDGRLVGQWPASKPQAADGAGDFRLADWQAATAVPGAQDGAPVQARFEVALPADAGGQPVSFTAYAFNRDRATGETSPVYHYTPPAPLGPRPRYAYVVAIGVNDYPADSTLALKYAVNDARAISRSLKTFLDSANRKSAAPPYQVVPVTLVSDGAHDQAAKARVKAVLGLLAGAPDADRTALAGLDLPAAGLRKVTPDDLVVIAFSGHGWADSTGDFYLLPSDARSPATSDPGALQTLISSAELADWLRGVDAGEMAIIIDACHSAASVATGGFKPGPMGDPGLGQLAYDKGIRILAATQAGDVAEESETLGEGHGLLTYALVDEGLGDTRAGGAERDARGAVRFDALLNYVVDTMPRLASGLRAAPPWLANPRWTPILVSRDPSPAEPPHIQQPALFDFTRRPSPTAVQPPPAAP